MLQVLIVTVAYNPPKSLISNLAVDYYPHMIVDNSEQETIWLKEYCSENGHVYRWLGDNLGIAKALNLGAKYALSQGFAYIVTMDQDSKLTNDILVNMDAKIFNFNHKNNVAIFSPRYRVLGLNDNEQLKPHQYTEDITLLMTSGNWVNLDIWNDLGGFNDDLFIDGVDVEYYLRSKLSNYRVIAFLDIFLEHALGSRAKCYWIGKYGFDVWNHSAIRKYYIARNYAYITSKYLNRFSEVGIYKKIIIKMPISIILFEDDKYRKLWYFFLGYLDFLRGRYGKFKQKN